MYLVKYVFILQDQERRTPLHAAACVGDVHVMDLLIESGEIDVTGMGCRVLRNRVALQALCSCSLHITGLTWMFVCPPGASVNAKDHIWLTPLHRAAASRNEVRDKAALFYCYIGLSMSYVISRL